MNRRETAAAAAGGGGEMEQAAEKIGDLHDGLSEAILALSNSSFLRSKFPNNCRVSDEKRTKRGFVYVKGFKLDEEEAGAVAAEARRLDAVRTALEDLEEQLEFFHTVQSQQRAERDAAIARLEQSRIILATRLSEFHGRKYKVIEEAKAFVGDVSDDGLFTPTIMKNEANRSHGVLRIFLSSLSLVKKFLGLDRLVSVLGNATLFAASVLVLLQMQQISMNSKFHGLISEKRDFKLGNDSYGEERRPLDVFAARG